MKKKILVVDDEEDIRVSVKMLLEDEAYEVKLAEDGRKALTLLRKEKFDLVLLDVLMPEMSGKETLERIRSNSKTKDQKVAFLTVVDISKYGKKVLDEFRIVEYFQKPIQASDFLKRIRKILH